MTGLVALPLDIRIMTGNSQDLTSARDEIDTLDRDLIRLLKQRMDAVAKVGAFKSAEDAQVLDPDREAEVTDAWSTASEESGLSPFFTKRILREILDHSRRRQELHEDNSPAATVRVGYQGIQASYSDLAAQKLFAARGEACCNIGYETFEAVFDALTTGKVDYALVPAENSLVGSIHAVSDLLMSREVSVLDEEIWSIRHCLVVLPGATMAGLRQVRSHPVALGQCRKSLRRLGVEEIEEFDTAGAAKALRADADPAVGVICSREAAETHDLEILSEEIPDQLPNETRFLLIGLRAQKVVPGVTVKPPLAFAVNHNCGAPDRLPVGVL